MSDASFLNTAAEATPPHALSNVSVAKAHEGLSAIYHTESAAVLWERPPLSSALQSWLDALDPTVLPEARIVLCPEEVPAAMVQICMACGTPDSPLRDQWIEDVAALTSAFATTMQTHRVQLRLDVVTNDACRRFHVDAVSARLICTYRGSGTQYGISADRTEPEHIFVVPTGMPILLRGTHWPEQPSVRLVHRSPPIEGTGETRLVLVLDPEDFASPGRHSVFPQL